MLALLFFFDKHARRLPEDEKKERKKNRKEIIVYIKDYLADPISVMHICTCTVPMMSSHLYNVLHTVTHFLILPAWYISESHFASSSPEKEKSSKNGGSFGNEIK